MQWRFGRRQQPVEKTVDNLQVRTAEELVILIVSPGALDELPVQLTCPEARPVKVVPGAGPATLDPNLGWTLPIESIEVVEED